MLPRDRWPWLFPASYAMHIVEEYYAGFPRWLSSVAGAQLSNQDFLVINAIAFAVMTIVTALSSAQPQTRWLIATLGTIVTVNAMLHIGGSILTRSYSPGAITGALLWLPLGLYALRRTVREVDRGPFIMGIAVGLLLHAVVSLVALAS